MIDEDASAVLVQSSTDGCMVALKTNQTAPEPGDNILKRVSTAETEDMVKSFGSGKTGRGKAADDNSDEQLEPGDSTGKLEALARRLSLKEIDALEHFFRQKQQSHGGIMTPNGSLRIAPSSPEYSGLAFSELSQERAVGDGIVGQNDQESRRKYWATRSSVCLFTHTARLFACFAIFALLPRSTALTRLLACSLCSLPRSWESK